MEHFKSRITGCRPDHDSPRQLLDLLPETARVVSHPRRWHAGRTYLGTDHFIVGGRRAVMEGRIRHLWSSAAVSVLVSVSLQVPLAGRTETWPRPPSRGQVLIMINFVCFPVNSRLTCWDRSFTSSRASVFSFHWSCVFNGTVGHKVTALEHYIPSSTKSPCNQRVPINGFHATSLKTTDSGLVDNTIIYTVRAHCALHCSILTYKATIH